MKKNTKVLFAAFEAAPFFKTGGLGEVAGSLPAALKKEGYEIRLVLPKLAALPEEFAQKLVHVADFAVPLGWRRQYCGVEELKHNDLVYYFIDNEYYFKRERPYGYGDDAERIAFFAKAVLEALQHLPDFFPDILHCNDWHTALAPLLLREQYLTAPGYADIKTVLSIHNLNFQGRYSAMLLGDLLGLWGNDTAVSQIVHDNDVNYICGGANYADRLLTVSPTYAQEICTVEGGEGLDDVFRRRRPDLQGIVNGIDLNLYDPAADKHLAAGFSAADISGKAACKQALQQELGLPQEAQAPLLVMVGRLTEQKGLDLLLHILQELLHDDRKPQVAVLGTGDSRYEEAFRWFAASFPGQVSCQLRFDDALAHRTYAGGDLLLMPSRFEPCGLAQMIAMRYGTLPVVRETGGLKDSVLPYNRFTGEGTGFSFANYNAHELLFCLQKALDIYANEPATWRQLVGQAMAADFGWQRSAKEYGAVYDELMNKI